jgi:hypothetical protein
MTSVDETNELTANTLCRSCGLCCTGHLFIWTKLRRSELDPAEALGMKVFRSDPRQRGFSQPCPLWDGECTIYATPHYPRACRSYQCKLLKEALAENISLPHALTVIRRAKGMIQEVEALLPPSPKVNFRERLVEQLEDPAADIDLEFKQKAEALLAVYEMIFGVNDVVEESGEE